MKHTAIVKILKSEQDRINGLLDIPSLSEMTDQELYEAGANTDSCEGVYYVRFGDGSFMTYDLCSGQENYYDNVVWTGKNGREIFLDCSYELADIEFDVDGETYEVKILTTEI